MEQIIRTTIQEAKIYFRGCSQVRTGRVALRAGRNTFYIEGLTKSALTDSIQLRFPAGVAQGSVNLVPELPEAADDGRTAEEALQKEIDAVQRKLDSNRAMVELWTANGDWSQKKEVSLADTVSFLEQLPVRLDALDAAYGELLTEKEDLEKKRRAPSKYGAYICVEIDAEKEGEVPFALEFIDENAYWRPEYEIIVPGGADPLTLRTKARVVQMTGEDWQDTAFVLFAGNPSLSGTRPRLQPWELSLEAPIRKSRAMLAGGAMMRMDAAPMMAMAERAMDETAMEDTEAVEEDLVLTRMPMPEVVRSEQQTMTEYRLPGVWFLASDDGRKGRAGKLIDLEEKEIDAALTHVAVPKEDGATYLVAMVRDKAALSDVNGEAAVYLEGAYAGKVRLSPERTDEEAELPLGCDAQVQVKRRQIKRFSSKQMLSSEKKISFSYEIVAVNHKRREITLTLYDQLPLSQDKGLTVEAVELSEASHDPETGELKWVLTLAPDETKRLTFSYDVKYPKDQTVYNL